MTTREELRTLKVRLSTQQRWEETWGMQRPWVVRAYGRARGHVAMLVNTAAIRADDKIEALRWWLAKRLEQAASWVCPWSDADRRLVEAGRRRTDLVGMR